MSIPIIGTFSARQLIVGTSTTAKSVITRDPTSGRLLVDGEEVIENGTLPSFTVLGTGANAQAVTIGDDVGTGMYQLSVKYDLPTPATTGSYFAPRVILMSSATDGTTADLYYDGASATTYLLNPTSFSIDLTNPFLTKDLRNATQAEVTEALALHLSQRDDAPPAPTPAAPTSKQRMPQSQPPERMHDDVPVQLTKSQWDRAIGAIVVDRAAAPKK